MSWRALVTARAFWVSGTEAKSALEALRAHLAE
jgi:hypothetical protein